MQNDLHDVGPFVVIIFETEWTVDDQVRFVTLNGFDDHRLPTVCVKTTVNGLTAVYLCDKEPFIPLQFA